jgi:hypothetical protein
MKAESKNKLAVTKEARPVLAPSFTPIVLSTKLVTVAVPKRGANEGAGGIGHDRFVVFHLAIRAENRGIPSDRHQGGGRVKEVDEDHREDDRIGSGIG